LQGCTGGQHRVRVPSNPMVRYRTDKVWIQVYFLAMQRKDKKRWKELCNKARVEKDPAKLRKLVSEINRLETKAPKKP
jgi:hypothetical protein